MNRYVQLNRDLWNEWTEINFRSAFYDVAGFKAEPSPLDPEVLAGLGDIANADVLHLQCHFGMDTLRIARACKSIVGVDFSPAAIARARQLAADTKIAARFVEADVLTLDLSERFDVVFTSYGVLSWLPDLDAWARTIARHLRPGGRLFLIESHPTMMMFDGAGLELKYPYFASSDPIVIEPAPGHYADPTATWNSSEYGFAHHLGEIVNALIGAGLRIDELQEYRHVVWKAFPFLVEVSPQRYVIPPERPQIPLMFSIRASSLP